MITRLRTLSIIFSAFALFALNSCDSDDDSQATGTSILGATTIYDVVQKNGSLSSLEAALDIASGNLPGTLSDPGTLTLFAPENAAFDDLAAKAGFASADDMLAQIDPALLAQILTHHVLASEIGADGLTDGSSNATLTGENLLVSVLVDGDNRTIRLLDATKLPQTNPYSNVTQSNPDPNNGTLHFVDRILLPQEAVEALNIDIRPSILDWATATPDLSLLVSALEKAGLVDTIKDLDGATVLAPNDQAFTDLLTLLGDDYTDIDDFDNDAEIALLGDILKYHVIAARVESGDLTAGPVDTALADNSVEIIAENGGFTFGDVTATNAGIEAADIDGINGVVHIIDKVLLPQSALDFLALLGSDDLATTVVDTQELSVLEEALIATELVGAFVDATNAPDTTATNFTYFRTATVFAPTDAAFADLLEIMGPDYSSIASFDTEAELNLLKEILLYHVVAGTIASTDLAAGNVTTEGGSDIQVIDVFGSDSFLIGNEDNSILVNILAADVIARNGVAHVIDKVLLPPSAITFINSLN